MKGAYCLVCREAGPDLVPTFPDRTPGLRYDIGFTCGSCGRRWEWTATMIAAGVAWELAGRQGDEVHQRCPQ